MSLIFPSQTFESSRANLWTARRFDWIMVTAVGLLIMIGMVFVLSAASHFQHPGGYIARQAMAVGIGVIFIILLIIIPYQVWSLYAHFLYVFGLLSLVGVLLFGTVLRGTKGWIDLGIFYLQPAEMARLTFILVLAAYLDRNYRNLWSLQGLMVPLLLMGIQASLIILQPDFSNTIPLFPIAVTMLFLTGAKINHLLALICLGSLAIWIPLAGTYFKMKQDSLSSLTHFLYTALKGSWFHSLVLLGGICAAMVFLWWFLRQWRIQVPRAYLAGALIVLLGGIALSIGVEHGMKEYQRKRLVAFIDPSLDPLGAGYNIRQSKIALGSGRFFGKGYLSGTQAQLGFIPDQHTDFIFSVVGEEGGFFISATVVFLYFFIAWRGFLIAAQARERFGALLAAGISASLAFYGWTNIGMVMGLMPVTGLPLPFVSYGGSALVFNLCGIGFLLSIHMRRHTL